MADFFQIRERAVLNKRNIKDKKALQKAYDLLLKKEKQYKSNSNYVNLVNRLYHSIDDFDAGNMDNQAYNELKKDIKKVLGNDSKQIIELDDMLKGRIREEKAVEQKGKGTDAVFKRGDTVSLLSFDRTKRGRAKVKGVTGARPNKFGIEHHYITDRGTFTDMEVEGTKAYRLRFKGNTEQEVMKFMRSRVLYK